MIKQKPVIGILATSNYMVTNDTFKDTYRYGNNYIKKIVENGGVPLLIPLCDENLIEESLDMCDGLILPGGDRVRPVNFDIIDHFYKHKKPMLGICLGMQTLCMYSINIETPNKRIIKLIDNGVDHWPIELTRSNNTSLAHTDYIEENTKLYDIFGKKEIKVNSVHKSTITEVGSILKVSIKSSDGLIEGIEYIDSDRFIIGTQFHPEILPEFNNIFKVFIDKCKNK